MYMYMTQSGKINLQLILAVALVFGSKVNGKYMYVYVKFSYITYCTYIHVHVQYMYIRTCT